MIRESNQVPVYEHVRWKAKTTKRQEGSVLCLFLASAWQVQQWRSAATRSMCNLISGWID